MVDIVELDNGLRVINEYMGDIESVSANVWVRTGSRNETKKINGISHFLEHMAFKGTKTRNTQQIAEEFDNIGGRVNAFTSISQTAFYTKVLKENTEKAVELLADIVQNSIFDESEIEKERHVILQELAMTKDDPSDIICDYFAETAYKNQPYGRSILGPEKNIKTFSREDIISYVNNQYRTEDIIISFAGNLKTEDAVKFVKKYFNNLKAGKNKIPEKAIYTGGSFIKNKKLEQTQLVLGFEGFSFLDEHFYEAGVLGIILGGGMSSKLFQKIREKKGLCYRIDASSTGSEDTGMIEISCATAPERTNEAIIAIMEELKDATQNISEEEYKRAIVKLKSAILMSKENNSSRAKKNVGDLFSVGRLISSEEIIQKIEEINTQKLKDLMGKILEKSNPTLALLGKTDKSVPEIEKLI
ncbi:MAG TPA: pitrilysin family protein [Rickettsiales bacterium]|nr:pitrilysin family protein [Rickettsiales bacterium]